MFTLNHKGAEEVLKVVARQSIDDLAQRLAKEAGEAAVVHSYTTDRAAAAVSVPAAKQAKRGVLTRAAAAVGLTVRARSTAQR